MALRNMKAALEDYLIIKELFFICRKEERTPLL